MDQQTGVKITLQGVVATALAVSAAALAIALAAGMITDLTPKGEGNHHTIVSTPTDDPRVRCYVMLDADKQPTQMSCVPIAWGVRTGRIDL